MKKVLAMFLLYIILFSMAGCVSPEPPEPSSHPTTAPTTEPTTEPTVEPTVEPTTEPTTEKEKTLADLDLSKMFITGGTNDTYYPFLYVPGEEYVDFYHFFGGDREAVDKQLAKLTPGFVYALDFSTGSFVGMIDEPILAMHGTNSYIFAITENNTLIVSDMTGTLKLELYQATEPLGLQSLGYCRKTLYFIEGSSIMNLDLVTGEVRKLIEYEGAIDADPLYGIEDAFPHLLYIQTETDDVACNLETGETAIIPETGKWGTAAFELYMEFGTWPETDK